MTLDQTFNSLYQGNFCSVLTKAEYAIRDVEQWNQLWNQAGMNYQPKIDFSSQMVIGIFMGEKSSGGYSIEITKIASTPNSLEVYIQESEPEPMSLVASVLTQPYHIVQTAKTDKEVKYIRSRAECTKK
jgi:hypothetical protein